MSDRDKIYLYGKIADDTEYLLVAPESLKIIFVLQCCENLDIEIVLTTPHLPLGKDLSTFRINGGINYKVSYQDYSKCPSMIQNCFLPAVQIGIEPIVVVGLSATIRHILQMKVEKEPQHISNRLLGFRKGCLQACAEVSIWTKFCEIEAIEMLKELFFELGNEEIKDLHMPVHIIRFERHLEQPPKLHNALKRKQENLEKVTEDKALLLELKKLKLNELPELDHTYAEGVDLTVSDLLLYVSFSLSIHRLKNIIDFEKLTPLILKWLSHLNKFEIIIKGKDMLQNIINDFPSLPPVNNLKIIYPDVPNESLYRSDPNRYKSRWRSFTQQKDIDNVTEILEKEIIFENRDLSIKDQSELNDVNCLFLQNDCNLNESNIASAKANKSVVNHILSYKNGLQWKSFPKEVIPLDGDLPLNRFERKCQQLESLVQVVIALAKDGNKIVDFCSGGGHLGIILAYLLPKCKIMLVENKKSSLEKAIKRVNSLKLDNVEFYQCNLDYFSGLFDIGICLHACGVATDLIMQKCYNHLSHFVCSPCCYGSVRPNHVLNYPRSELFSDYFKISPSDYLILGHAADQTHDKQNPKTEQGKKCMKYVDFDRLSAAQSLGYSTFLCTMNPPECTPKNHILIGIK